MGCESEEGQPLRRPLVHPVHPCAAWAKHSTPTAPHIPRREVGLLSSHLTDEETEAGADR